MSVKVVKTKFKKLNDKYLPLVVVNGELEPSAATFIMQRYEEDFPYYTIETEAKVIKKLYEFCLSENIDIIGRISELQPLTVGEIESLLSFYSARSDTGEVVAPSTRNLRIITTTNFITYLWNFYEGRLSGDEELIAKAKKARMDSAFKLFKKTPFRSSGKDKIGLTPELRAKFFEIINPLPDNKLNPWKNEFTKWRNYCLFLTMILGGNRKGESLGLKLNHFHLVGADSVGKYYKMEKERLDDFPHKVRPAIKTDPRRVALSPLLVSIFEYYITKIRPKAKNHHRSQYMFLSLRSGQPIGLSTPNDSMAALIKKHPEYKGMLTPHILRNTYFDALRDNIDGKLESESAIAKEGNMKRLMEYAGGWASGSKMPDRYSRGSIQRKVAEFNLQIQTKVLGES